MGLASAFGWDGVDSWIDPRRNTLLGVGSDFLSGRHGGAAMQGRAMDDANATRAKEDARRQAQIAQAAAAARASGAEQLAQLFESGMSPGEATGVYNTLNPKAPTGSDMPANVREWEYFNSLDDAQKAEYLTMKRASQWLNTQTEHVRPDPLTGSTAGAPAIPINNAQAASDTAVGQDRGEATALAESWKSKLPGLRQVVDELGTLADTATYTIAGQAWDEVMKQLGQEPSDAAVARAKYIAMVDNQVLPLLRDTFGAQFTVEEGKSLRATLGDPNKSPAEKKAVLEAFIDQKYRDLEALQSRAGGAMPSAPGVDDILSTYGL